MERRRVLGTFGAGAVLLGLAPVLGACTSESSDTALPSGSPSSTASVTPDPRAEAATIEAALFTYAERVLARYPDTEGVVRPVRDGHAAHVVALVGVTPTATPPTDANEPRLSVTASGALRALSARERAAATNHAAHAVSAEAGTARLLASIAAFASAQSLVLMRSST